MNSIRPFAFRVALCCSSLMTSSAVQAQDNQFQLAEKEFNERFDEFGRVSGDIVMGVMIGPVEASSDALLRADAAPRSSTDIDVVALPASSQFSAGMRICVRLNSKDGRFEAENTYRVADVTGGLGGSAVYEGDYSAGVKNLPTVSLVKLGQCGDRTEVTIPSIWAGRMPEGDDHALHIFVNSAGNPTVVVPGRFGEPSVCEDIADETALKYTALCVLPLTAFAEFREEEPVSMTFYVSRSLGDEKFSIAVLLPKSGA